MVDGGTGEEVREQGGQLAIVQHHGLADPEGEPAAQASLMQCQYTGRCPNQIFFHERPGCFCFRRLRGERSTRRARVIAPVAPVAAGLPPAFVSAPGSLAPRVPVHPLIANAGQRSLGNAMKGVLELGRPESPEKLNWEGCDVFGRAKRDLLLEI